MELYATVRQLVFLDGLSRREVARRLGISRAAKRADARWLSLAKGGMSNSFPPGPPTTE